MINRAPDAVVVIERVQIDVVNRQGVVLLRHPLDASVIGLPGVGTVMPPRPA